MLSRQFVNLREMNESSDKFSTTRYATPKPSIIFDLISRIASREPSTGKQDLTGASFNSMLEGLANALYLKQQQQQQEAYASGRNIHNSGDIMIATRSLQDNEITSNTSAADSSFYNTNSNYDMNVALTIVYLIIFLIGVIGNVCNCLVIADGRNRDMKTPTNYYLFSLSVSDLLLLIFGLPHDVINLWHPNGYMFNQFVCITRGWISEASTNASVLVIVAFSMERYLAICHPLKAHKWSHLSRSIKIICLIWMVASTCAIVVVRQFGLKQMDAKLEDGSLVGREWLCTMVSQEREIFALSVFLFFILPMSIITILYLKLGWHLRKKSKLHSSRIVGKSTHQIKATNSGQSNASIPRYLSLKRTSHSNIASQPSQQFHKTRFSSFRHIARASSAANRGSAFDLSAPKAASSGAKLNAHNRSLAMTKSSDRSPVAPTNTSSHHEQRQLLSLSPTQQPENVNSNVTQRDHASCDIPDAEPFKMAIKVQVSEDAQSATTRGQQNLSILIDDKCSSPANDHDHQAKLDNVIPINENKKRDHQSLMISPNQENNHTTKGKPKSPCSNHSELKKLASSAELGAARKPLNQSLLGQLRLLFGSRRVIKQRAAASNHRVPTISCSDETGSLVNFEPEEAGGAKQNCPGKSNSIQVILTSICDSPDHNDANCARQSAGLNNNHHSQASNSCQNLKINYANSNQDQPHNNANANNNSNPTSQAHSSLGRISLNSNVNTSNLNSVFKMLVSVVVMFFICWAPFHAQRLMAVYVTEPTSQQEYIFGMLNHISGVSYYISAVVNPILYSLYSRKFRQAFWDTFSCLGCSNN